MAGRPAIAEPRPRPTPRPAAVVRDHLPGRRSIAIPCHGGCYRHEPAPGPDRRVARPGAGGVQDPHVGTRGSPSARRYGGTVWQRDRAAHLPHGGRARARTATRGPRPDGRPSLLRGRAARATVRLLSRRCIRGRRRAPLVINFPTKRHWRGNNRIEDIDAGLVALIADVRRLGIASIAVPPLGCGLGGLDWAT